MLTLYYVSATFLQSWRINKICQKISEQLAQQATVSFYALPQDKDYGFYPHLATSELCCNRQIAKVTEILWMHDNNRACCLMPLQSLQTSAWISFPDAPGLRPFHFGASPESLQRSLSLDKHSLIRLLIETESKPCHDDMVGQKDVVRIENYGKLIAWKIDSHLAVLIETNEIHFTRLLVDTFLQNHFLINDQLPVLRIESVRNDGTPQPYSMLCSHLRKPVRSMEQCKPEEWSRHLEDLRALSVLANQAIEYASNKNKADAKTAVIKPDLIPQEKRTEDDAKKTKDSPKKPQQQMKKSDSLDKVKRDLSKKDVVDASKISPEKTKKEFVDAAKVKPAKVTIKDSDKFIKAEQVNEGKQAAPAVTTTLPEKPSVSVPQTAPTATSSAKEQQSSPSKLRAKPTEIKKPGAPETGRFKTAKMSDHSIKIESKKHHELVSTAVEKSLSEVNEKTEMKISNLHKVPMEKTDIKSTTIYQEPAQKTEMKSTTTYLTPNGPPPKTETQSSNAFDKIEMKSTTTYQESLEKTEMKSITSYKEPIKPSSNVIEKTEMKSTTTYQEPIQRSSMHMEKTDMKSTTSYQEPIDRPSQLGDKTEMKSTTSYKEPIKPSSMLMEKTEMKSTTTYQEPIKPSSKPMEKTEMKSTTSYKEPVEKTEMKSTTTYQTSAEKTEMKSTTSYKEPIKPSSMLMEKTEMKSTTTYQEPIKPSSKPMEKTEMKSTTSYKEPVEKTEMKSTTTYQKSAEKTEMKSTTSYQESVKPSSKPMEKTEMKSTTTYQEPIKPSSKPMEKTEMKSTTSYKEPVEKTEMKSTTTYQTSAEKTEMKSTTRYQDSIERSSKLMEKTEMKSTTTYQEPIQKTEMKATTTYKEAVETPSHLIEKSEMKSTTTYKDPIEKTDMKSTTTYQEPIKPSSKLMERTEMKSTTTSKEVIEPSSQLTEKTEMKSTTTYKGPIEKTEMKSTTTCKEPIEKNEMKSTTTYQTPFEYPNSKCRSSQIIEKTNMKSTTTYAVKCEQNIDKNRITDAAIETDSKKASELEKIAAAKVAEQSKSKSPSNLNEQKTELKSTTAHQVTADQGSMKTTKGKEISPSKQTPTKMENETKTSNTDTAVKQPKSDDVIATATSTSEPMTVTANKAPISVASASSAAASAVKDNAKRPSLKRHKDSIKECKPLNILVYAETATARESAINTLKEIIAENTYTIYPMSQQQAEQKHWLNSTALLVVCGSVANAMGELFVDYFLHGGKVLSLCSDVLHFILPTYRTAEVREHELVQFSYDKWQKVKMMHHIFCYQPSPVKKNFSTDSDDSAHATNRKPALVCPPRSIELKDLKGHLHQLDVKVLGTEETWNTPSLLLANNQKSGGSAVFSQVHLEISPSEFESDELKFSILKQNDQIRHEIFSDLLKNHLNLNVKTEKAAAATAASTGTATNSSGPKYIFKKAYFLGKHEAKFELLDKLKERCDADNAITTPNLMMKFCGPDDKLPNANSNILPILIHSCPEDFSTVDYFENLKTRYVGRLVIYAPVVSSSQHVVTDLELTNGIAVIPRQQTAGVGRSNNQWLSPLGCAMFSLQLHISLDSLLGKRLPLLQHIIGAAMVNALKGHDLYKVLNIGLKWPNDTYANGVTKIGGLVVKTTIIGTNAYVNIGCGINLDNDKPTICINDMIREYNHANQKKLPLLKYETFLAMMFNEIEKLCETVQGGDFETFYKLYYELWLHRDQSISISDQSGSTKEATIVGIDEYGYLQVKLANGSTQIVHPDGNTFDMLKGLIVPKFN